MIHGLWTNSAATFCNQLTRDLMAGNDDFVSGQPYDNNLRGKYSYMINCSFYLNFFLWILSILLMFGTVDWTFLEFNNYLEIYKIKHSFLKWNCIYYRPEDLIKRNLTQYVHSLWRSLGRKKNYSVLWLSWNNVLVKLLGQDSENKHPAPASL